MLPGIVTPPEKVNSTTSVQLHVCRSAQHDRTNGADKHILSDVQVMLVFQLQKETVECCCCMYHNIPDIVKY